MDVVLQSLLDLGEGGHETAAVVNRIKERNALWLAFANFELAIIDSLSKVPAPRNVLWRIEFMGKAHKPFLHQRAVDPIAFTERMLALGHLVVPYSFNHWNRRNISALLPLPEHGHFPVQPIAQKGHGRVGSGAELRERYGIPADAFVIGVAGVYEPAKGIDEMAEWIQGLAAENACVWAIFALITDNEPAAILAQWQERHGRPGGDTGRIIVRKGIYKEWDWMLDFYRAIDVMLVNSQSDSWGRVVSEPAGIGTPVIVRSWDCGTDHSVPGVFKTRSFAHWSFADLIATTARAKARAADIQAWVTQRCDRDRVQAIWLKNLRRITPAAQKAELNRLVDRAALGDLPDILES